MVTLRDYQLEAIENIKSSFKKSKRVMLIAPTGTGKTVMFSEVARRTAEHGKGKVLVLVHRLELATQAVEALAKIGLYAQFVSSKASYSPNADVFVAMVQSMVGNKIVLPRGIKVVIVDEAHHTLANSYIKILNHYGDAYVLGVTATPIRSDGKNLLQYFPEQVTSISVKDAISQGFLCDYIPVQETILDYKRLKIQKGEYTKESVREITETDENNEFLVESMLSVLGKQQAIVFGNSVEHSMALQRLYTERNIKIVHLDSKTDKSLRKSHLEAFKEGRIQMVTNFMLFDEGVNLPNCNIVQLTKPTMSVSKYLQMVGRVLRPKKDGSKAIVLDNAGNIKYHGMPDIERDWSCDIDTNNYKQEFFINDLDRAAKNIEKKGGNAKKAFFMLRNKFRHKLSDTEKNFVIQRCGFQYSFIKFIDRY